MQAGQTVTVKPRRGSQDKRPWRDLVLNAITGRTIEKRHLYDVHLGETVVPYAMLDPLKALLPDAAQSRRPPGRRRRSQRHRPCRAGAADAGAAGKPSAACGSSTKPVPIKLTLLGRLDYHRELSSQLALARESQRPPRASGVFQLGSGRPAATASLTTMSRWLTTRIVLD